MVYVISKGGKPLMPCANVIARLLLKQKKAKVLRRTPFTIKLLYETTTYTQEVVVGVDTGSSKLGCAATSNGNVLYVSEVEVRNDITKKMKQRASFRRTRRGRKLRYRKPRWLNRKNSIKKDKFSPTMRSKFDSHEKEINFVKKILPVSKIIIETGTFDPHLLKNPVLANQKVKPWGYQKGRMYGFANAKAYVLSRDNYACQCCKAKGKGVRLEVHHVVYRSQGGSDNPDNLITLCVKCHEAVHKEKLQLKAKGLRKGLLLHATQMNSIRVQLLRRIQDAIETYGYITKENRENLNLPKEHFSDAVAISSCGEPVTFKINVLLRKKCIAKGDYKQTRGIMSEEKMPTGKIYGFRKFDKVKYLGQKYFIKGRMSSGYAFLMDIDGNKIDFSNAPKGLKTAKLRNLKRLESRKSWIIDVVPIQRIV